MVKFYTSLGLMSGTSMDGIDASLIRSNGTDKLDIILNRYLPYNCDFSDKISKLKDKIYFFEDLRQVSSEIKTIEREITISHAKVVNEIKQNLDTKIDLIGFHGQTIYHNASEKKTVQLGDANLLSQLTKNKIINNFRQNDIDNNGNGAPLTPIFHKLIQNKLKKSMTILNIGGITNETVFDDNGSFYARDIGPGNCLIDKWIKLNTNKLYDKDGKLAESGKINKIILDQSLDVYFNNIISQNRSFDINDFDFAFVRGLSIADGSATITEFTAEILSKKITGDNIYVSGEERKNKFLIKKLENKLNKKISLIDELGFNGDFVESQAFAYIGIRSFLNLPITFPNTTGCDLPCSGGKLFENF